MDIRNYHTAKQFLESVGFERLEAFNLFGGIKHPQAKGRHSLEEDLILGAV
jgi:hypothetical protein